MKTTVLNGNAALSRRSILFGLAAAPAAGVTLGAIDHYSAPEQCSPRDRLQYHLLMAAAAADELAPGAQSRWMVTMFGKAGTFRPSYMVKRYDAFREPHPRVPQGILIEMDEMIACWNS